MKLHSTGYETRDYGLSSPASVDSDEAKMRTVYPELHIRANEDGKLPKLCEGECYIIAKVQKVGYRAPVEEGSEKSCDIAIMAIAPISESQAKSVIGSEDEEMDYEEEGEEEEMDGDDSGEAPIARGFRSAMLKISGKGQNEDTQVG